MRRARISIISGAGSRVGTPTGDRSKTNFPAWGSGSTYGSSLRQPAALEAKLPRATAQVAPEGVHFAVAADDAFGAHAAVYTAPRTIRQ